MRKPGKKTMVVAMVMISPGLLCSAAMAAMNCDYDSDQDVDGIDLARFSTVFASRDPVADVNGDSSIDQGDLRLCAEEFARGDAVAPPTVAVLNIQDNSVVKTGFLVGTASGGNALAKVEVSLDAGAFAPAAGTLTWKFPLPAGSAGWRDGSRHTICVRAQDMAGNYSAEVTLVVRKGNNKDVNGDGYVDLAVNESVVSNYGKVYLYHGGPDGVTPAAQTTIWGEELSNSFGDALALGDINGDGYADLIIGDYGYNYTRGKVWILHGGAEGIASRQFYLGDPADTILYFSLYTSTNFGCALACGDVNGDGYADLGVGAMGYYGMVHVFYGAALGIPNKDLAISDQHADFSITGNFGRSFVFADFNGDGYDDLAAGAEEYNSYQGRTCVYYGSQEGLQAVDSPPNYAILTGDEGGTAFGYVVTAGDANGDGYQDLVVGASRDFLQGWVYLFHGGQSGIQSGDLSAGFSADATIKGVSDRNQFGNALALGDLNGDSYDDLAAGSRLYDLNRGRVHLFYGSGAGLAPYTDLNTMPDDFFLDGESQGSLFGQAIVFDDLTADGYADLTVSAPNRAAVYVFHGDFSDTPAGSLAAGEADTILNGFVEFGWALGR
ncbi:MAG: FG-GAP-like repeat-containing protein [Desulfobulbaceae bacterium]|nr:FG-GAP-like repeat-containing protein [Desulfobulbaceae bacterium]